MSRSVHRRLQSKIGQLDLAKKVVSEQKDMEGFYSTIIDPKGL